MLQQHEDKCEFLSKSSGEIIQCLQAREAARQPSDMEQARLLELLSVLSVLKPYFINVKKQIL